jgi:hypothetical protein
MDENNNEEIIDETLEEKIPSLEDLKNKENISLEEDDDLREVSASQYKKSLKKKVSEFSEEEKAKYNALSQKKKRKKDKEEEITELSQKKENDENQMKKTLYNQLFCLKQKFPENTKNVHIDPEMSVSTLEEKKALILQIITSKNADRVVFQSLLLLSRSAERGLNYFDIDALEGYSHEVEASEQDILPILKELIDTGEIDTSFLTPQLRLMVVMSGCVVRTLEKNNAKKKVQNISGDVQEE